ncbi:hypothetical protein BJ085DRAFT_28237 [Dimargaris cristalligena]|uniref:Uncharacterized protein n=1 Tax=Dimargaris cristalligena TaxID=215637 RepID=A0A4P9ZQQ6_9FUNG|nr:hypothetical protein BJ085DRAFT_28237 [Dimargaris cristalligena]|eukprot:RKP35458.1 hypothetical protein BJ085DRAFT_28237 [Dimargaris cristalligena]
MEVGIVCLIHGQISRGRSHKRRPVGNDVTVVVHVNVHICVTNFGRFDALAQVNVADAGILTGVEIPNDHLVFGQGVLGGGEFNGYLHRPIGRGQQARGGLGSQHGFEYCMGENTGLLGILRFVKTLGLTTSGVMGHPGDPYILPYLTAFLLGLGPP